jgi:hypothetical protein
MIFILADHGDGLPEGGSLTYQGNMAYLAPLVLFKPFHSERALAISNAPVVLADVRGTVFSELGMKTVVGQSLTAVREDERRPRKFFSYDWWGEDGAWEKEYLPVMREYVIDGFSWDKSSWKITDTFLASPGARVPQVASADSTYEYGQVVWFGEWIVESHQYIGEGWAKPEIDHIFSEGSVASLTFPVKPPKGPLLLEAQMADFGAGELGRNQRVIVKLNGKKQGTLTVNASDIHSLPMSVDKQDEVGRLNITFEFPDERPDQGLGQSASAPRHAIKLFGLKISTFK